MKGERAESARRVRALRRQRGWSQEDLAKHAKIHKNTVSNLESGHSDCRMSTLYKVAETFQVDVRDLLMPLRRDASAWIARLEQDLRRAWVEIDELKQLPLSPGARERVERSEHHIRRGLEDLQQVKLRVGRRSEEEQAEAGAEAEEEAEED